MMGLLGYSPNMQRTCQWVQGRFGMGNRPGKFLIFLFFRVIDCFQIFVLILSEFWRNN